MVRGPQLDLEKAETLKKDIRGGRTKTFAKIPEDSRQLVCKLLEYGYTRDCVKEAVEKYGEGIGDKIAHELVALKGKAEATGTQTTDLETGKTTFKFDSFKFLGGSL